MSYPDSNRRELNSDKHIKKLLNNLDNPDLTKPQQLLETQAHLINYKKHQIQQKQGIRTLILKRNNLGSGFA